MSGKTLTAAMPVTLLCLLLLLGAAAHGQEDLPLTIQDEEASLPDSAGTALPPLDGEGDDLWEDLPAVTETPAADDLYWDSSADSTGMLLAGEIGMPLQFESQSLQEILRTRRLGEEENERFTEIFRADSSLALALFQLRGEEYPRYYPASDLWIYIWRGRGELLVDQQEQEYAPGQFLQIPAGTLHAFRNLSGAPTVGLVWQRPPLDDSLTVEFVPEEVIAQMRADSLRTQDLQERSLYKQNR